MSKVKSTDVMKAMVRLKILMVIVPIAIIIVLLVSLFVYSEMKANADGIAKAYRDLGSTDVVINSKSKFMTSYIHNEESEEVSAQSGDVHIDSSVFSATSIRINTEIYEITAEVFNPEHFQTCYGDVSNSLFNSVKEYMDPYVLLSFSLIEKGDYNTLYNWTPAVYSKHLEESVMGNLRVADIGEDFYTVNFPQALECGTNCSGKEKLHVANSGKGKFNDNCSLGPLQILRNKLDNGSFKWSKCGGSAADLLNWRDQCEWVFHNQGDSWSRCINKDATIDSGIEMACLMYIIHNGGAKILTDKEKHYQFVDWEHYWSFCKMMGEKESEFQVLVDEWYEDVKEKEAEGKEWTFLSTRGTDYLEQVATNLSIDIAGNSLSGKQEYSVVSTKNADGSTSFLHKNNNYQLYACIKMALNYLSIKKLYTSGT